MKNEHPIPVSLAAREVGIDRRRMYEAIRDGEVETVDLCGRKGILPSEVKRYAKTLKAKHDGSRN